MGGWQLGRSALIAADALVSGAGDSDFLASKIATARFYSLSLLPQAAGYARAVVHGSEPALELAAEQF